MAARSLLLASLLSSLLTAGCETVEPVYDDELGVTAIPAEEGALAGTFALKVRSLTLETTPVFGEQEGGGTNLALVTRTWDDEAKVYRQETQLCHGDNYEVAGVTMIIPTEAYQAAAKSTEEVVTVDHARGTYLQQGHLQLWGIRDLPDPYETPLPKNGEEASQPPHDERVYDHEGDGSPGVTIFVEGLVSGEIYGVQRKTLEFEGVILGKDRALGFSRLTKESVQLGANNDLLTLGAGASRNHPDPKESWFEEIRIEEGAGCDDVIAAEEDGRLPRLRSF